MGIGNARPVSVNVVEMIPPLVVDCGIRVVGCTKVFIRMEKMKNGPVIGRIIRHPGRFRHIGFIQQGDLTAPSCRFLGFCRNQDGSEVKHQFSIFNLGTNS
jgi:hypothetical protein